VVDAPKYFAVDVYIRGNDNRNGFAGETAANWDSIYDKKPEKYRRVVEISQVKRNQSILYSVGRHTGIGNVFTGAAGCGTRGGEFYRSE
jgi:hypothetical protein